jgi:hypothetical protein
MLKNILIPALLLICCSVSAQTIEDYRSSKNPHYWKNKLPFPGYWQQDVHYQINARIDEQQSIIDATETLTYFNNSPDTLKFVFFHLYQNAFVKGAHNHNLHLANNYPVKHGKYESAGLGTKVNSIKINGNDCKTELDNTILKVWLPTPLLPDASVKFDINFKTYFDAGGNIRRRMKQFNAYGNKHFDGVHWYPRICVYDRKFGWETDQHLGKEFYGDFGLFDVKLDFSDNYVVEATGVLQNKNEVLPPALRKQLDISNFLNKPWESPPSIITPYNPAKRKTWHFVAEHVHDFAFTADPTYRIGETYWEDVQIVAVVQEPHASGWANAASYTAKIIETYSRDFGRYIYPKMVVADARDGMEYPMLTLDGGFDPNYRGLLAHEVGHNWFFGMIGTNETYRAFMDEGFTQFLTAWALEKIDGETEVSQPTGNKWIDKYRKPEIVRFSNAYFGYLRDAIRDAEVTLNTHSDDFAGALRHGGGYGNVYYKTAVMLYNLQYVLGDSLFQRAMKNYFNQWAICHPYPEDFRNSFIHFTKVDLNWFFDQWLETSKTLDYKISRVKKLKNDTFAITLKRVDDMQMPIDFTVTSNSGKKYNYHIPNTWFVKETSAQVLPRWIGWGQKLNPEYTAKVVIPDGIEKVQIDTTFRLADRNLMNNSTRKTTFFELDHQVRNLPEWKGREVYARPDVWYNAYDGFKLGMHLNSNYMQIKHQLEFSFWINTGLASRSYLYGSDNTRFNPISYNFKYQNPTNKLIKGSDIIVNSRWLDGLTMNSVRFQLKNRSQSTTYFIQAKSMIRTGFTDVNYLLYGDDWVANQWNNTLNAGLEHSYSYNKGFGKINVNWRSSTLYSDYDYAQISLSAVNKNRLKKWVINTRFMAQYGSASRLAPESALFFAGANPEEMMESKFYRSQAFFPDNWAGISNLTSPLHMGGGLNVRGYAGYLLPYERSNGETALAYAGNTGVSSNIEIEFDQFFKFKPKAFRNWLKVNTYAFADGGLINTYTDGRTFEFTEPRISAGFGAAFTIKNWGKLEKTEPLTIRFDCPLFLNRTPALSPDFVQLRYLVSIGRAF